MTLIEWVGEHAKTISLIVTYALAFGAGFALRRGMDR